jgi:hypothetical protein
VRINVVPNTVIIRTMLKTIQMVWRWVLLTQTRSKEKPTLILRIVVHATIMNVISGILTNLCLGRMDRQQVSRYSMNTRLSSKSLGDSYSDIRLRKCRLEE